MIVSLNEIAATATKAVRGSGHAVGIAEDIGFATRWLCEHGLPGGDVLAAALADFEQATLEVVVDKPGDQAESRRVVEVGGRSVPAVQVAPSLVELAIATAVPVRVADVTHAILVVPFIARAATAGRDDMSVRWTTIAGPVQVDTNNGRITIRANSDAAVTADRASDMTVGPSPRMPSTADDPPEHIGHGSLVEASRQTIATGCEVTDEVWQTLGRLAWQTYVPVSAESRLKGAGAGLTDND